MFVCRSNLTSKKVQCPSRAWIGAVRKPLPLNEPLGKLRVSSLLRDSGKRHEGGLTQPLQLRVKAGAGTSVWRGWGGQETGLGNDCSFSVRRQ